MRIIGHALKTGKSGEFGLLLSTGDRFRYFRHFCRSKAKLFASILLAFGACFLFFSERIHLRNDFVSITRHPLIVVITPTYVRPTRLADLTRMANTVRQVDDLHWIVVEDSDSKVDHVERLLNRTALPFTYLSARTIEGYPKRGWYQRTVALNYLRENRPLIMNGHTSGVLYFGDDDNAYDLRLFTEYLRNVKRFGLWAVGMVGGTPVESPDVVNGTVVGFQVKWNAGRMFAVDMAGFGIGLNVVFNSTAVFGTSCGRGAGAPETCLLEDMGLTRADIEPFGYEKQRDRDIMVWHTKTNQPHYNMTQAKLNGHIFEDFSPKNVTVVEQKKDDTVKSEASKTNGTQSVPKESTNRNGTQSAPKDESAPKEITNRNGTKSAPNEKSAPKEILNTNGTQSAPQEKKDDNLVNNAITNTNGTQSAQQEKT